MTERTFRSQGIYISDTDYSSLLVSVKVNDILVIDDNTRQTQLWFSEILVGSSMYISSEISVHQQVFKDNKQHSSNDNFIYKLDIKHEIVTKLSIFYK